MDDGTAHNDSAIGLFGVVELDDLDDPIAAAAAAAAHTRSTTDAASGHKSLHANGAGVDLDSLRELASSVGDEISTYRPSASNSKSALDRRAIPTTIPSRRGQSGMGTRVSSVIRHGGSAQRSGTSGEGRYRGGLSHSASRDHNDRLTVRAPALSNGHRQRTKPSTSSSNHMNTATSTSVSSDGPVIVRVAANICGDREMFRSVVDACDVLANGNGALTFTSPNAHLVFCGNAVGMGNADMTVAKALLRLKKNFPDRVHLLAGGMDVVALRCASELAEGETGAKTDVYWKSDCVSYRDFIQVQFCSCGCVENLGCVHLYGKMGVSLPLLFLTLCVDECARGTNHSDDI